MAQEPPNRCPLRVLVVEDDDATRESFHCLMGMWGHACEAAADGRAAIQTAAAFLPDVVLMDIGLPDINGWETVREMRKLHGPSEAAIVAVTGWADHADADRSYAQGFAAHLVKPANMAELRALLESIAEERAGLKPDAPS